MSPAFREVLRWELKLYAGRASTWIYFGIFAAIGFLMMCASAGAFDQFQVAFASGGKVKANAPYAIALSIATVSLLGISVTAAISGNSSSRDYELGTHPLFFTTPVSKGAFLGGRYAGTLLVNLVVLAGIGVGLMVATWMPFLDKERLGAFSLAAYAAPYLTIVLPNLLFVGAIFFALAAVTRQMLPNYVGAVMLLVGYLIAAQLANDMENRSIAAVLDPFGIRAMGLVSRYWSIDERNTRTVPLVEDGEPTVLLWNRLLYIAVGALVFAVCWARFRFAHQAPERTGFGRKRAEAAKIDAAVAGPSAGLVRDIRLPAVARDFGRGARWAMLWSLTRRAFWGIVKNRYFAAIVGAGILFLATTAGEAGKLYGTTTYPVTYEVIELLEGSFGLFVIITITFYAGELVWAERDLAVSQIVDATPMPTWVSYLSKLLALIGVTAALMTVTLVAGIITQALKGYYKFEIPLYLQSLYGIRLLDYVLLIVLVLAIHVLVNNKYLGHFLAVLFYLFTGLMGQMGLEHNLYTYGSDGGVSYSDMNEYGHFIGPFFWWKLYWGAFAVLLAIASNLLWVRGLETVPGWRTKLARGRLTRGTRLGLAAAGAAFLATGAFIFYNTNVLNTYRTSREGRKLQAEYERLYKKYEHAPQPRIVASRLAVDLVPTSRDVRVAGSYLLRNRTASPIDTVHVRLLPDLDLDSLAFDRPASRVLDDEVHGYRMWRLATPLAPGDSMRMTFRVAYETRGFENDIGDTQVVENGTFLSSFFLPGIGYSESGELGGDDARKKEKLPVKERMAPATDLRARMNTYVASDADWLDYEATISTDPDQIALTSGYLQREWTEGGRRYFHYKMDAPILSIYAFQSGRYRVKKDAWTGPDGKPVAIEVYYHPGHEYNLERMIHAVKQSLAYYTANFSPYQHRQVRIVEFPRYARFAQSLPNTIPYSEAIGFIARITDPLKDIDYPFYVTAHEVAHQWWAHQVIGGNVQGSTMLSETMAQYSALMIMEREYGPAQMKRFLEYELDNYLLGRSTEQKREMPLVKVENQPYIHYRKGSLVMYALKDYIGEAALNGALKKYIEAVAFQQPPYTTAPDLVTYLRAATPDSLQYVIDDLFERITLYENRTDSATVKARPDGVTFDVTLHVTAKKLSADTVGRETEVPMRDWVDVGVFGDSVVGVTAALQPKTTPVLLYHAKHRIARGSQTIPLVVQGRMPVRGKSTLVPTRGGVDPLHKLVDRQLRDNVITLKKQP